MNKTQEIQEIICAGYLAATGAGLIIAIAVFIGWRIRDKAKRTGRNKN